MTKSPNILSSSELATICGGQDAAPAAAPVAGVLKASDQWCKPDNRWFFQKILPMGYGGREKECINEDRAWFNKGALSAGEPGKRSWSDQGLIDVPNAAGQLK